MKLEFDFGNCNINSLKQYGVPTWDLSRPERGILKVDPEQTFDIENFKELRCNKCHNGWPGLLKFITDRFRRV